MGKLVAALRAKDEEIFVGKTIEEVCSYVDGVAFIDDWSKDRTVEIVTEVCKKNGTELKIVKSPDERYHEGRDRDILLNLVHEMQADWCIQIDADEVYEREFAENIRTFTDNPNLDIVWIGATHMWSFDEKPWYEVDTFRADGGWSTSFLEDGVGIQHNRPALFRIIPEQKKSGSLRDHGYLCPQELWSSNRCLYPTRVFAHFGYATPELIKKKCRRHGSIPPVTKEEIEGKNYSPDYKPENFNPEAAANMFMEAWLKTDGVELKPFTRKIWRD